MTPILQRIINDLNEWAKRNSMTIHPGKTELMIISRTGFIGPLPNITINGYNIKLVPKTACSGKVTLTGLAILNRHVKDSAKSLTNLKV